MKLDSFKQIFIYLFGLLMVVGFSYFLVGRLYYDSYDMFFALALIIFGVATLFRPILGIFVVLLLWSTLSTLALGLMLTEGDMLLV